MVWLPFGLSSVTSFPKKIRAQVVSSAKVIRDPRTLLSERQRQMVIRREELGLDHLEEQHRCCLCSAKGTAYRRPVDDDTEEEEDGDEAVGMDNAAPVGAAVGETTATAAVGSFRRSASARQRQLAWRSSSLSSSSSSAIVLRRVPSSASVGGGGPVAFADDEFGGSALDARFGSSSSSSASSSSSDSSSLDSSGAISDELHWGERPRSASLPHPRSPPALSHSGSSALLQLDDAIAATVAEDGASSEEEDAGRLHSCRPGRLDGRSAAGAESAWRGASDSSPSPSPSPSWAGSFPSWRAASDPPPRSLPRRLRGVASEEGPCSATCEGAAAAVEVHRSQQVMHRAGIVSGGGAAAAAGKGPRSQSAPPPSRSSADVVVPDVGAAKTERRAAVATFSSKPVIGRKGQLNPLLRILVQGAPDDAAADSRTPEDGAPHSTGKGRARGRKQRCTGGGGGVGGGDARGKGGKKKRRRYRKCHDGGLRKIHETEVALYSSIFHRSFRGYLCRVCSHALKLHVDTVRGEVERVVAFSAHKAVRTIERKSATQIVLDKFGSPVRIRDGASTAFLDDTSPHGTGARGADAAQQVMRGGCPGMPGARAAVIELWPHVANKVRMHVGCVVCHHRRACFFFEEGAAFLCSICCARDREYRLQAIPVAAHRPVPAGAAVIMATLVGERSNQRTRPRDHYTRIAAFVPSLTLFRTSWDLFRGASEALWPHFEPIIDDPCVLRVSDADFDSHPPATTLARVRFAKVDQRATTSGALTPPSLPLRDNDTRDSDRALAPPPMRRLHVPTTAAPPADGAAFAVRSAIRETVRSMGRELFRGRAVRSGADLFTLVWPPRDVCDFIVSRGGAGSAPPFLSASHNNHPNTPTGGCAEGEEEDEHEETGE